MARMVRVPPKIGCRFSSGCPRRFPCKPGAGIAPLRIACRFSGCDRPCVRAVRDVSARRFAGLREGRSADLGEAAELVRVGRARRARGEAPPPHRRSCPRRLGVSYGNRLGDALVLARYAWGLRSPFASPECTDRRVVKKTVSINQNVITLPTSTGPKLVSPLSTTAIDGMSDPSGSARMLLGETRFCFRGSMWSRFAASRS